MDIILIGVSLIILFGISIVTSAYMTTHFYNSIIELKSRIKLMHMAEELYQKVLIFLLLALIVFIIILLLIF